MGHVSLLGLASQADESHLGHASGFQHRPLATREPKVRLRAAFLAQGAWTNVRGGAQH